MYGHHLAWPGSEQAQGRGARPALDVLLSSFQMPKPETEAADFSGPCPCPILCSPGDKHLLGALSVL